jgi:hypothetical protein
MVPYIAILIVLIVAILFMVYKRVDGFEMGMVSITKDTTVEKFLNIFNRLQTQNKAIKAKIDSSRDFNETLSQTQLEELGLQEYKDTKPVSKAISMVLEKEITEAASEMDRIEKKIASGAIKLNGTLEKSLNAILDLSGVDIGFLNIAANAALYVSNNREAYVNSKAIAKTKKKEKKDVNGLNMEDLFSAVTGTKEAIDASSSEYEEAPEQSTTSTKEMEDRIAKNVATQLKDSLLAKRATQNPMEDISCPYASVDSNAVLQGRELTQAKPSSPDMSEYFRKDSIPCWNCSLP